MGYSLKKLIANIKNFGLKRALSKIKYIVIHYTANDGDTDESNSKYFKNNVVKSSAHYFVDDDSVTQSVEDDRVAWHCGGKRYNDYKKTGGAKFYGKCTNTNSLGIEMCDTVKDGKHNVSKRTLDNTIDLVKKKMKQYNIPVDRVIRHFDVTGKNCPKYFVEDEKAWNEFKSKLTADVKKGYTGKFPVRPLRGYFYYDEKREKVKDKGEQVKRLQKFLNWAVNAKLVVDGSLGQKTSDAIKKYQKTYGLKVDGFFGKESLEKAKTIKK